MEFRSVLKICHHTFICHCMTVVQYTLSVCVCVHAALVGAPVFHAVIAVATFVWRAFATTTAAPQRLSGLGLQVKLSLTSSSWCSVNAVDCFLLFVNPALCSVSGKDRCHHQRLQPQICSWLPACTGPGVATATRPSALVWISCRLRWTRSTNKWVCVTVHQTPQFKVWESGR